MAANGGEHLPDIGGFVEFPSFENRPKEVTQDVPGSFHCFWSVERPFASDAFAPADYPVNVRFNQEHPAIGQAAKTGFEGRHQRHSDFAKRDPLNFHFTFPGSSMPAKSMHSGPE